MIVAVAGGKGGVGKTTVAYNLGCSLDAVVVDADLGMANLPGERGPTLHDVLAGRATVHEARRGGPVDLLPCGRSLAGARAADPARLGDALSDLLGPGEDAVLDCPAGMRADAGVPLAVADCVVLVASPRRFALADAVRTRALARTLGAPVAAAACNRVVDDVPRGAVERALGAPTVTVPADPRVGRSVERETPVPASAPDSEAGRAFRALARRVQSCRSV
ncbi:MAG: chromosome partitioning protein ParA [Haloferacaceae archaeon]